jgi:hypothetical protein
MLQSPLILRKDTIRLLDDNTPEFVPTESLDVVLIYGPLCRSCCFYVYMS